MPDIKISEVARLTGLSMRYWQRRALRGDMPGAHYFETGNRRIYFVDRDRFTSWWSKQLREVSCPATSENAVKSGGSASPRTALRTKARCKPQTLASLKSALKEYAKS